MMDMHNNISRRDFIKGSAGIAAAVMLGKAAGLGAMLEEEPTFAQKEQYVISRIMQSYPTGYPSTYGEKKGRELECKPGEENYVMQLDDGKFLAIINYMGNGGKGIAYIDKGLDGRVDIVIRNNAHIDNNPIDRCQYIGKIHVAVDGTCTDDDIHHDVTKKEQDAFESIVSRAYEFLLKKPAG
jgi:hypothetical protein